MKNNQWICSLIMVFVLIIMGTGLTLADVAASEIPFGIRFYPQISYNPIEKWRMGLGLEFESMFGDDELQIGVQNALFTTRDFSSIFSYGYKYENNEYYLCLVDELGYRGVFNRQGYYQRDQLISVGVTRWVFKPEYFYEADLMMIAERYLPGNQPFAGQLEFDTGTNLSFHPYIFGAYKGYLGKLDLEFGIPTEFTDYSFTKASALMKKGFDLTRRDRLVITSELGYINGIYPMQKQFYLGSSAFNLVPNFKEKVIGKFSGWEDQTMIIPTLGLDGFQDNLFYGDKMYVTKLEYQRELFNSRDSADLPRGASFMVKTYTVFGDAWSGDVVKGFKSPHTAVGFGLQMKLPSIYPDMVLSWNVARGFGEGAATTFGIEMGTTFQFSMMNQQ